MLTDSQKVVTPVKTGVQWFYNYLNLLDSDFRRNDGNGLSAPFCEVVNIDNLAKRPYPAIYRKSIRN
jgi:hypothetical protein